MRSLITVFRSSRRCIGLSGQLWDIAVIRNFNNEGQLLSGTADQLGLHSGDDVVLNLHKGSLIGPGFRRCACLDAGPGAL